MPRGLAIGLLPVGFVIAVIDAWMSIQSIIGMMAPESAAEFLVGGVVGCTLTVIAVAAPALRVRRWPVILRLLWSVILAADLGTSVLGAIWYGVMRNKPTIPIDPARIRYDPGNMQRTVVFLAFVAILAAGCVLFGRILHRLGSRDSGP